MTFQFLLYILLFRKAFFVFILTCKCECLLRFRTFNDMFEELHQKQSQWTVPDTELRESLQLAVAQILLPAYRSFVGRSGFVLISINCKHDYIIAIITDSLFNNSLAYMFAYDALWFHVSYYFTMMHDWEPVVLQVFDGRSKEFLEIHQIHNRRSRSNVGWIFWRKKHERNQAINELLIKKIGM